MITDAGQGSQGDANHNPDPHSGHNPDWGMRRDNPASAPSRSNEQGTREISGLEQEEFPDGFYGYAAFRPAINIQ